MAETANAFLGSAERGETMLKVVVADDEARVCRLILMLADWDSLGMEVVGTASNGFEALDLVQEFHPDILITDIRMPGCHGLELIQQAKSKFPQLEIVIISGYANFEYAQSAMKLGVGDYLLKPIKREGLMTTLEKLGQKCRQKSQSRSEVDQLRQDNRDNAYQLQKRLLLDLLNGRLEDAGAEKLWSEYRFRASQGLYQIALLKMDYAISSFSATAVGIIQEKAEKIFQSELQPLCDCFLMAFQDGWGCCLLGFGQRRRDMVRKHLRNCLNQVTAQRSMLGNIEFSLALGPVVPSAQELPASCLDAVRVAANRLTEGTGRLLETLAEPSNLEKDRILEQYRRTMDHGVEVLDCQILAGAVEQLEREIRATPHIRGIEMQELVIEAGRLFLLRLEIGNRDQQMRTFKLECDQCSRVEGLLQCLLRLQLEQTQTLKQRRLNDATRPIQMTKQYVQKHYSEPITLGDVCMATGFSVSYFSTLFKKETGEGFAKYLTRVRMTKAKELLQQTNLPVAEICTRVGYSDLKHFTQNFKKETNLNPSQYRKLYG